jgi:predicted nucleic acid-binding Zn ribbon protein
MTNLPEYFYHKFIGRSSLPKSSRLSRDNRSKNYHRKEPIGLASAFADVMLLEQWDTKIRGARIMNNWSEIAGLNVSVHVKVVRIDGGVLHLKAQNPTWMKTVMLGKKQLINKINTFIDFDLIIDIRITC